MGIVDLAHFIGGAVAYVGCDTGVMHLAVAVDTPTVGIFFRSNPLHYAPLGDMHATALLANPYGVDVEGWRGGEAPKRSRLFVASWEAERSAQGKPEAGDTAVRAITDAFTPCSLTRGEPSMRRAQFRLYGRLLKFLRPHVLPLVIAVVGMMGFAALSGFSLAMVIPFTEIILAGDSPEELTARHTAPSAPDSAPAAAASAPSLRKRLEVEFYSAIGGADRRATLQRFCIAIFLVFLAKNLFWYLQSFFIVRVEQNVIRDIRDRLFRHYQTLSHDYYAAQSTGTLISRITNDVDIVRGAIANGFANLIRQSFLLLVYLVTVLLASWQWFLLAIIILPPNLWIIDRVGHILRRSSTVSQEKMARLTSVLDEAIGGARIVKAFGLERNRIERFSEETNNYSKTMIRMTRVGSLASPLTEMLGVLMAVVLLWYVGSKMVSGDAGSGRFLLFIVGMLSMMQPIKSMSQVNIKVQQGLAAAKRIFEVLDTVPTVRNAPDAVPAEPFSRDLVFTNVSFEYAIDVPVIHDLNLRVERGTSVAVVGPSGAGKSTLIDLIPRFHDPSAGTIRMDGADLRSLTVESLRSQIGIVTQETILFEGTIAENIGMGSAGASRDQIEAAARAANAHEFIVDTADGYDTFIGERGRLLSGGQRQRLSIARALLKNPAILIFDEATSSLDTESEALVQAAIDRLLEDRTAFIVAHRLSTIRRADVIVVLQEGRLVQMGSHDDLMADGGLYRRLFHMQELEPPPPIAR